MEVAGPVITSVTESSLVVIKKHLDLLVSSSKYVRDMHAKMTELNGAAHDMRARQVSNEENSQVVPHRVSGWLAEVDKIKARADRIPIAGTGCCNINAKYKAGKQSCEILEEIERLVKEKTTMVWTNQRIPLGMVRSPRASNAVHVDDQAQNRNIIKSRELIFNDVLKSLEPNNIKTQKIALWGMPGVGKTTMMEDLVKAARTKYMFKYIVKVSVGQNPNLVAIQNIVAEYLGEALTETSKETRAERLQRRFEDILKDGEKKILIILDDVWGDMFSLKDIGLTSPLSTNFKLLLTSREGAVCTQMGTKTSSIFKIDVLKEVEDKDLFWETVGLGSTSDIEPDILQIGECIIKKCGGLPLAITAIASTLRDKEKEEWKDTLSRLQNKKFVDYNINPIFEISYTNLKDDDLKAIFLLCGLFPEDSNIIKEDILIYGWGLKFFLHVPTITEARIRVNTCVKKLIRSNLLIESDREGCVKMHDLVRDFVLSSHSKVKQALIVNYNNDVSEKLRGESYERILLKCEGMIDFPKDFNHPNLALLKLMDGDKRLKFPEHFYTRMEKLEVVEFQNIYQPMLPQYSTNLRALCVLSCSLIGVDISFIGDLINLEVLRLVNCKIEKLPSQIGNLRRLKLLDLTKSTIFRIADDIFRNLEKLEELYMGVYKEDTTYFTSANWDELKILSRKLYALELEFNIHPDKLVNVSLESLERFRISMGCLLVDDYSFKNTLKLTTSSSELVECKINELFQKTEILHLEVNDMIYLEDILMHPPQSSFCNLKELCIFNCSSLAYLFSIPMAKVLTKLEDLKIRSCRILKSVVNSENTNAIVIIFPKLKNMSLRNLPELISLCGPNNMIKLPQLTKLKLEKLRNITSIFSCNHINIPSGQPFFNKKVVIPKLERLTTRSMKNLKEIWSCEITSTEVEVDKISSLREIQVHDCDNLVNLFPSNSLQLLIHLESLEVMECGSIEVLFNIDFGKFKQHNSNNILRKIKVYSCESLRAVLRIEDAENNCSDLPICGFPALENIEISCCKKFRNIVTPTTVYFVMRALKAINIHACGEYDYRKNDLVNNGRQINTMSKEETSIAFPSHQIKNNFHQLSQITFDEFQGVEVMFEIESPSDQFPYLEELRLIDMNALSHVWKCNNWNEFFIHHKHQPQSSFQNLTSIDLLRCKSIKYLFSSLMVKLFCNLKEICVSFCDAMEEVVSNKDDEYEEITTSTSTQTTTTLFPHLNLLKLYYMDNLKHIGGGFAKAITNGHGQSKFSQVDFVSWSVCEYLKEINIRDCDALSSVIPSYAIGRTQKLQVLTIKSCSSMMEVFETKEMDNNSTNGYCTTSSVIPRPGIITMHKFPNLKILKIVGCKRLKCILTFSTFKSLTKLEKLTVKDCQEMKVIVMEEHEEQTTEDMVFPHLKSIKLSGLPILEGFLLGMNIEFLWPLLDYVFIDNCPQMTAFTSGRSTAPRLKYLHTDLGKHVVEWGLNFNMTPSLHQTSSPCLDGISSCPTILERRPWSYHNLIEIKRRNAYGPKNIFPSHVLQQLQRLETIHLEDCIYLEVFEVKLGMTNNESQTVVEIPKLREMKLVSLLSIKYIWKSHKSRILEFPNLTTLFIDECYSLEHVFTCSMAGSLIQLQELHIRRCKNIKAIIKQEEEDFDATSIELKLPRLRSLKLDGLSSLKGFCLGKQNFTLPSLDTLVIYQCPITVFTEGRSITPELTTVKTSFGSFNVNGGEDINTFIVTKKQQGFEFYGSL